MTKIGIGAASILLCMNELIKWTYSTLSLSLEEIIETLEEDNSNSGYFVLTKVNKGFFSTKVSLTAVVLSIDGRFLHGKKKQDIMNDLMEKRATTANIQVCVRLPKSISNLKGDNALSLFWHCENECERN